MTTVGFETATPVTRHRPAAIVAAIDPEFRNGLLAAIPALRRFAISLIGRSDRADDLVQETLMKAWLNHASFQRGTNLDAWLFKILRNEFYTVMRRKRREIEDIDGAYSRNLAVYPNQPGHMDITELNAAVKQLPAYQRKALLLVAASGLSYDKAAKICRVETGTIKSRVKRARTRLAELMGLDHRGFGPDAMMQAVMSTINSGMNVA